MHRLVRNTPQRTSRRVGRGGKRGTYSGRGIKGLGARAGGKMRPEERDIIKRFPKLRGYRFTSFRQQPVVVNLDAIAKRFKDGDVVSPVSLMAHGLIRRVNGKTPMVKILGRGEIKKKLVFKDVQFSKRASMKLDPPRFESGRGIRASFDGEESAPPTQKSSRRFIPAASSKVFSGDSDKDDRAEIAYV